MKSEKEWMKKASMYININILKDSGISLKEIPLLQVIAQNTSEDLSECIKGEADEEKLRDLFKRGLVSFIKPKRKGQDKYELVRITQEARKTLETLRVPEITEGDSKMYEYLVQRYLDHEDEDRVIGNRKKTLMYVAIFRKHNNLSLHEMYYLCMYFLEEYKFTKILEYIFLNSNKQRYSKLETSMDDSPLYQFLQDRKEEVENIWKRQIREEE